MWPVRDQRVVRRGNTHNAYGDNPGYQYRAFSTFPSSSSLGCMHRYWEEPMSTDAASTLLTLADISVLARVQRPVVSMWRKHASKSDRPFPEPVVVHGRQELFESAAVIDWLEATRRGNNPAHACSGLSGAGSVVLPGGDPRPALLRSDR